AFEELRKLRRDFADVPSADQPSPEPAATGPGAGAAPDPEPYEAVRAPAAPASSPREVIHGPEARTAREADEGPACSSCDVGDRAARGAFEPADDARAVTNEARGPADPFGRGAAEPAREVAIGPVTPTVAEPSDSDRPGQPDEGAGRPDPMPGDDTPVVTNEAK